MFKKKKDLHEMRDLCIKFQKENESLKEENAKLKGTESQLKKAKAELEHFYLNEIGRCETVDEVKKIWFRFSESEFGSSAIDDIVSLLPKTLGTGAYARNIKDAAITKIKRINKKNIMRMCQNLDNETNKMEYARIMMNELKETAEIEADGKKIIDARKSGMDAWGVFLSMLAEYKVRRDSVF